MELDNYLESSKSVLKIWRKYRKTVDKLIKVKYNCYLETLEKQEFISDELVSENVLSKLEDDIKSLQLPDVDKAKSDINEIAAEIETLQEKIKLLLTMIELKNDPISQIIDDV